MRGRIEEEVGRIRNRDFEGRIIDHLPSPNVEADRMILCKVLCWVLLVVELRRIEIQLQAVSRQLRKPECVLRKEQEHVPTKAHQTLRDMPTVSILQMAGCWVCTYLGSAADTVMQQGSIRVCRRVKMCGAKDSDRASL